MKSSWLSTEPWWTLIFTSFATGAGDVYKCTKPCPCWWGVQWRVWTSNSSLYPSPTQTWLRAFVYIPCTSRTTPPHQVFSAPTRWLPSYLIKPLLQVYKSHVESLVGSWILLLQLPDNKDCVCCASAWDKAKQGIVDWHQLSDEALPGL